MGIIVDTSIFIAAERGKFALNTLHQSHPKSTFYIAAITASELLMGVHRADSTMRDKRSAVVEQILFRYQILSFGLTIARVHAFITADTRSKGRTCGMHDMQIAATAIAGEHQIATLNKRSFPYIHGAQLLDL